MLENELTECQNLAESTGENHHLDVFFKKKAQLADLLEYRTQGALVRSRFQNISHMDAPSKFFFLFREKKWTEEISSGLAVWRRPSFAES